MSAERCVGAVDVFVVPDIQPRSFAVFSHTGPTVHCRCLFNILGMMELLTFSIVSFCVLMYLGNCQLIVNVRNNGGDVYRETIEANTTQDSISLDFRKSDGTLITQFIDGRNVNIILDNHSFQSKLDLIFYYRNKI